MAKNILTALWCAMLGAEAGYGTYSVVRLLSRTGASFSDLPVMAIVAIALLAVFAICALGGLIAPRLLFGAALSAAGVYALSIYGVLSEGGSMMRMTGLNSAITHLTVVAGVVIVGCLAFAIWNSENESANSVLETGKKTSD